MAVAAVRLPVLGMVGRAFEDVWASLGGVARMAGPWYAAALAPTLAGEVAASYGAGSALWDVAAGLAGGAAGVGRSAPRARPPLIGGTLGPPARARPQHRPPPPPPLPGPGAWAGPRRAAGIRGRV